MRASQWPQISSGKSSCTNERPSAPRTRGGLTSNRQRSKTCKRNMLPTASKLSFSSDGHGRFGSSEQSMCLEDNRKRKPEAQRSLLPKLSRATLQPQLKVQRDMLYHAATSQSFRPPRSPPVSVPKDGNGRAIKAAGSPSVHVAARRVLRRVLARGARTFLGTPGCQELAQTTL